MPSYGVHVRRLAFVLVSLATIVVAATPAAAHSVSGVSSTNFRTTLKSVRPRVDGITMRVIEAGSRFELTNTSGTEALVLGYDNEPYLRVGPRGVFENRRSPTTYRNADRQGVTEPPADATPDAPPEWRKVSDGQTARWHDHRVHWMGSSDTPPAARRNPDRVHVVIPEWTVPVRLGDRTVEARGDLVWVPPPSAAPWLAIAAGLFVLTVALAFSPWWSIGLALLVAALVAVDVVHATGVGFSKAGSTTAQIAYVVGSSFYSVFAWAAGIVAVVMLRRRQSEGLFAAGFTGAFIALSGGLVDVADLSSSQVPFAWGAGLARLFVAISIGVGVGLIAAAVVGVKRHPPDIRVEASEPVPEV